MAEQQVDMEECLPLVFGQEPVRKDGSRQVNVVLSGNLARLQDPSTDVQGLRRYSQGLRDLLEYLGRRATQSPFNLAEVRVRYAGKLGEPPQRHAGRASLFPDEGA